MLVNLNTNWQLTMGDAPSVMDLTPAVVSFEIGHPLAEPTEPLTWSGRLVLTDRLIPVDKLPESIDDEVNPTRWAFGAQPIRLYVQGEHFLTCRIGEDYFYDEDTGQATATLTDKLALIDREYPLRTLGDDLALEETELPPVPARPFSLQVTPWPQYCQFVLEKSQASLSTPLFARNDLLTTGIELPIPYSYPGALPIDGYLAWQFDATASPASTIQQIFLLRKRWIWCNKDEKIDSALYGDGEDAIYGLPRRALLEFQRLPSPDLNKSSTLAVGGTGATSDDDEKEPEVWPKVVIKNGPAVSDEGEEIAGSSVELERRIIQKPVTTGSATSRFTRTEREVTLMARMTAFPVEHPTNPSQFQARSDTKIIVYDKEGYPLSSRKTDNIAKGVLNYEKFQDNTTAAASVETEFWEYSSRKQMLKYVRQNMIPAFAIHPSADVVSSALKTNELEIISHTRLGADVWRQDRQLWKARREGVDSEPYALVLDSGASGSELLTDPPSPPLMEPQKPVNVVRFSSILRVAGRPTAPLPPEVQELKYVSGLWCLDWAAETLMKLREQRRKRRRVAHGWIGVLANYRPFQRIDLHDGAYIIDGLQISIAKGSLTVQYSANRIGAVPAVEWPNPVLATLPPTVTTGTPVTPTPPAYVPPVPSVDFSIGFLPPGEPEPVEELGIAYFHSPASLLRLTLAVEDAGPAIEAGTGRLTAEGDTRITAEGDRRVLPE